MDSGTASVTATHAGRVADLSKEGWWVKWRSWVVCGGQDPTLLNCLLAPERKDAALWEVGKGFVERLGVAGKHIYAQHTEDVPVKRLRVVPAFVTSVFLVTSAPLSAQSRLPWFGEFSLAEAVAERQGNNLLIHFHADWCGPCQTMERTVLRSQRLESLLTSGIVAVRVNVDRQPGVARRFGITSIPADVVVSPTGKQLASYTGQRSLSSFVATVERFRNRVSGTSSRSATENHRSVATRSDAVGSHRVNQTSHSAQDPGQRVVPGSLTHAESAAIGSGLTSVLRTVEAQRVGLGGYCPVMLSRHTQWAFGRADLVHEHDGVRYLFSTTEARNAFIREPQKYVPAFHGHDVVALSQRRQMEPGAIELGARFRDRLYFFKSDENRDLFLKRPHHFAPGSDDSVVQSQQGMK